CPFPGRTVLGAWSRIALSLPRGVALKSSATSPHCSKKHPLMSGWGQTRPFGDAGSMSGLAPGADMVAAFRHFRKVPIGDLSRCSKLSQLFDYLVGDLLKMQRHVNTKCLGGLNIDHQLELRGLLDRQVGGLLTLENPTGVGSIQAMRIRKTASVA